MKFPWMQFYATDWLNDPAVSACEPQTRGILVDWLCNMHLLNRCGQLVGTVDQLARQGRCSPAQVSAALADLQATNAADVVTDGNKIVTVTNRRMRREYIARNHGRERVERFRTKSAGNAPVTVHSHNSESESDKHTQTESDCESVFCELEQQLKAAYNREQNEQLTPEEERLLEQVATRPNAVSELSRLTAWRDKMQPADKRYFPQTIKTLLAKWADTLDRARLVTKPAPIKSTPMKPLTGPKLPDAVFNKLAAETLAAMKQQAR